MKRIALLFLSLTIGACATPGRQPSAQSAFDLPAGVTMREASWYSEQVRVSGRLFTPAGHGPSASAPAVALAPGWEETAETLDAYAAGLAAKGVVALSIDYRGWGRSGGHIYLGERVDVYDRMRFSDHTPELVIRRGRLDPEHQVQDLRNAITFLQSEPGVDRSRIGILGVDMAGGHVISVMGMDARVKAGVAITPVISGSGEEKTSFLPNAATQAEMIRLAREGAPPRTASAARARNAREAQLALGEYKPFWRLDAMPQTSKVFFIVAEADEAVDNAAHALAAAHVLEGRSKVKTIRGAAHRLSPADKAEAARLAAEWFSAQFGASAQ